MARMKRDVGKWVPARIKALRDQALQETQEVFARRFPVSIDTVRYWEQSRGAPGRVVLRVLDEIEAGLSQDQASRLADAMSSRPREAIGA